MKIIYFAWLRERLNRSEEEVSPPDTVRTVNDLIDWKIQTDEDFALQFEDRALFRAAVGDELVEFDATIAPDAQIAFLPPMTGG